MHMTDFEVSREGNIKSAIRFAIYAIAAGIIGVVENYQKGSASSFFVAMLLALLPGCLTIIFGGALLMQIFPTSDDRKVNEVVFLRCMMAMMGANLFILLVFSDWVKSMM
jgi:hypothetical protein